MDQGAVTTARPKLPEGAIFQSALTLLVLAFTALFEWARWLDEADHAWKDFAVGGAVCALLGWIATYVLFVRRMDEFRVLIELKSLALSGGAVVAGVMLWGIATAFYDIAALPLQLIGPFWAVLYGAAHLIVRWRYA